MTISIAIIERSMPVGGTIATLWVSAALMTAGQVWMFRHARGWPAYPALRLYFLHLLEWLPWALLAAGILYFARRRPWTTLSWRTANLFYLPLGVVLTLAKFLLEIGMSSLTRDIPLTAELLFNTFVVFMATAFPIQVLTAWAILGTGLVVSDRIRLRQQAATPLESNAGPGNGDWAEPGSGCNPEGSGKGHSHARRLTIRSLGKTHVVDVSDIDRIEAADYYAEIHALGIAHLTRVSLSCLEQRLDPELFVRIHRSTIINIQRISRLESLPGGGAAAFLHDGTRKRISRSRRRALERALANCL